MSTAPHVFDETRIPRWVDSLLCSDGVIGVWAGCNYSTHDHSRGIAKLFRTVLTAPVEFALSRDVAEFFAARKVKLSIPRALAVIGDGHCAILHMFHQRGGKFFTATSCATLRWTGFRYNACVARSVPRAKIVRRICAHLLIAGETRGVYFPVLLHLRAALSRLAVAEERLAGFLAGLDRELLSAGLHGAVVAQAERLAQRRRPPVAPLFIESGEYF